MSNPTWRTWLALALVIGCISSTDGSADEPPANPQAVLRLWKESNAAASSFRYQFKQTVEDKVLQTQTITEGAVVVIRPDSWRVEHTRDGKRLDTIIVTKKDIHVFDYEQEVEIIMKRPEERRFFAFWEQTSFWDILNGGFAVLGAQQHYWFYLGSSPDELDHHFESKVTADKNWVYLELTPRKRTGDFQRMQVVLHRQKLWVRRIWTEQPSGRVITLDLERPAPMESISLESLSKDLPRNWKQVKYPLSIDAE